MNPAGDFRRTPSLVGFTRAPWNRRWFWLLLTVALLAIDYFAGPSVVFPVFLVFPVLLAAWNSARREAIILALTLPIVGFSFNFLWDVPWTLIDSLFNAFVWALVLIVLAMLAVRVSDQNRELALRLNQLEGLLPICAYCKRIRDETEEWIQLEAYISQHSKAHFSHGICPACARQQHAELLAKQRAKRRGGPRARAA